MAKPILIWKTLRCTLFFFILFANSITAIKNSFLLDSILQTHPKYFKAIINNLPEYQIQIIYTQINRDSNNIPHFKNYTFNLDSTNYFYPASLVKLPCAALALEKIKELKVKELTKFSSLQIDSAWHCQKPVKKDSSTRNGLPSIANYIKKMLLVSDNDAYNRLFEFLGQDYIQEHLFKKGYNNARIVHRFDVDCMEKKVNKITNPISFFDSSGKVLYQQPMQACSLNYKPALGKIIIGKGHINSKNKFIGYGKDFTYYNYLPLTTIHSILKSILFPEQMPVGSRFNLEKEDYLFLQKYLSMLPRESIEPIYSQKEYHDSYKKYFVFGTTKKSLPHDSLRIFNVVGKSFGYLSDCAYVCDFKNKIEFMLSAVIYVNKNGIINDGKYEYDTIGIPFLSNLGVAIYEYEKERKKEFFPNLENFKFSYTN